MTRATSRSAHAIGTESAGHACLIFPNPSIGWLNCIKFGNKMSFWWSPLTMLLSFDPLTICGLSHTSRCNPLVFFHKTTVRHLGSTFLLPLWGGLLIFIYVAYAANLIIFMNSLPLHSRLAIFLVARAVLTPRFVDRQPLESGFSGFFWWLGVC